MNILPSHLWLNLIPEFINKADAATFLSQITSQSKFLTDIREELPTVHNQIEPAKKKKKLVDTESVEDTEPSISSQDANKYFGRGIFYQKFKGLDVYRQCGKDLNIDLVNNPDLALDQNYLLPIALWYWKHESIKRFLNNFEAINQFLEVANPNILQCNQLYTRYTNLIG